MILLFGNKANKNQATNKTNNIKGHPVENSGILAMTPSQAKSLLTMGEYDTYVFSNPTVVNYSLYSGSEYTNYEDCGFMSDFSSAIATLNDAGFCSSGFDCACSYSSAGASCSSFSSFS